MTLKERIIAYLKKQDRDVLRDDILAIAERAGYSREATFSALKDIEGSVANIGIWYDSKARKNYCRYYEPNALTIHTQECLDRGDDW